METPASDRVAAAVLANSLALPLISTFSARSISLSTTKPVDQMQHGLRHEYGSECLIRLRRGRPLPGDEGEQIRVDLILMCGCDTVRRSRIVNFLRALN